jgi:hypothetical protein
MKVLAEKEFNLTIQSPANIILKETPQGQPKVIQLANSNMLKIFYPKRKKHFLHKVNNKALLFCQNAQRLRQAGFIAPQIQTTYYYPAWDCHLVQYNKIAGQDLRSHGLHGNFTVFNNFANYLCQLHQAGIFFRAIHLENILYTDEQQYALIDICDVRFQNSPLSAFSRYRNFKHLFVNKLDRPLWHHIDHQQFLTTYFTSTRFNKIKQLYLNQLLAKWINQGY